MLEGVPDDIISFGGAGPRRKAGDGAGPRHSGGGGPETIESVFAGQYARLVRTAATLVDDGDLAEALALQAFVRLSRPALGTPRNLDLDSATQRLERALARLAALGPRRRPIERRARRRRLRHGRAEAEPGEDLLAGGDRASGATGTGGGGAGGRNLAAGAVAEPAGGSPVNVAMAWQDFRALRARSAWRLRGLMAASAVVVGLAIALPVAMTKTGSGGTVPGPPGSNNDSPGLNPRRMPIGNNKPIAPPVFEDAIVARLGLGGVISLTGDATSAWAVRAIERARGGQFYQLVGIDMSTNMITLRLNLGRQPRSVTDAFGTLWITTSRGRRGGQLVRIDQKTGQVRQRLHLPAGRCGYVAFSAGHLVASCQVSGPLATHQTDFLGIDPGTGRVLWQAAETTSGQIGAIAITPQSVWYIGGFDRVSGLVDAGGGMRAVSTDNPAYWGNNSYRGSNNYQGGNTGTQSLASGRGSIWVLGYDESVGRIDPLTGIVQRIYTRHDYDPLGYGGLSDLAVGNGALWFLDNGYPFNGVLRVSPATGRPVGLIAIPAGSCGQLACSQIYLTPGAVWVPTRTELIRIDPARIPAPDLFPQTLHHELAASAPFARGGGGTLPLLHVGSAP